MLQHPLFVAFIIRALFLSLSLHAFPSFLSAFCAAFAAKLANCPGELFMYPEIMALHGEAVRLRVSYL